MTPSNAPNYTHQLQQLMQQVGVSSFKALSQKANVSEWQVRQLRQGQAAQMRVEALLKLSQTLQISLLVLISTFSQTALEPDVHPAPFRVDQAALETETLKSELIAVKLEYERSQVQLAQQREILFQEFQQATLQAIESWLIFWPSAAYAAKKLDSKVTVEALLPLANPITALVQQWGVEAIAEVGTEVSYDPTQHQLIEGTTQPGDRVRVRYTGYRQGKKLLYRAKVSPVV